MTKFHRDNLVFYLLWSSLMGKDLVHIAVMPCSIVINLQSGLLCIMIDLA